MNLSRTSSQGTSSVMYSPPNQTVIWLEGNPQPLTEEIPLEKKKKKPKRQVAWTEDTIDNENMDKLKSNICCIYHKPHGEDSSSSTCTSDDDMNEIERSRQTKLLHKQKCSKYKGEDQNKHNHSCGGTGKCK